LQSWVVPNSKPPIDTRSIMFIKGNLEYGIEFSVGLSILVYKGEIGFKWRGIVVA
jgi:hypothetical protein